MFQILEFSATFDPWGVQLFRRIVDKVPDGETPFLGQFIYPCPLTEAAARRLHKDLTEALRALDDERSIRS